MQTSSYSCHGVESIARREEERAFLLRIGGVLFHPNFLHDGAHVVQETLVSLDGEAGVLEPLHETAERHGDWVWLVGGEFGRVVEVL